MSRVLLGALDLGSAAPAELAQPPARRRDETSLLLFLWVRGQLLDDDSAGRGSGVRFSKMVALKLNGLLRHP